MSNSIKLIAGGDLCPADHYFTIGHGYANTARVEKALCTLMPIFKISDLAIVNLESPLSQYSQAKSVVGKKIFRGDPDTALAIKSSGISHLHVANNHILQHGTKAFYDSINALKNVGIQPIGYSEPKRTITPVLFSANGLELSIVGVSFVSDAFMSNESMYDAPKAVELIEFVKQTSRKVDHVIISIHWGSEGPDIPSSFEVILGRKLIDAGASVILGHHSHIVRPVERRGNGLIFYSFGNLMFDLEWYYPYSIGMLAEITLGRKESCPTWKPYFFQCKKGMIRLLSKDKSDNIFNKLSMKADWLINTNIEGIDEAHDLSLRHLNRALNFNKLLYFICMLPYGNTMDKLSFIANKISNRITALYNT